MTDEERQIITRYVERVAGVGQAAPTSTGPWGARSVPSTQPSPNLPPVDPEADRLITDLFARHPEARYRITQTAFVQEAALVQAQNRIQDLEWQLENAQNQAQANQGRGGLFGGMFGGGNRQVPTTPPPQPIPYPQGMNPGMMQGGGGGGGFLRTAAMTAAGVAGGMVLGNVLMNAFSGHGGAAQAATSAASSASSGAFGEQAVNTPSSPWTNPGGQDAAPVSDQSGGWGGQDASPVSDSSGNWGGNDAAAYDDGGYDDAAGFDEDV